MAINWLDDLGAPAVVIAARLGTRNNTTTKILGQPLSSALSYGLTVVGYGSALMNWGGRYGGFLKNIGIASLPTTAESLYDKFKSTPAPATAARVSRLSRYPGPTSETPFQGVRLV